MECHHFDAGRCRSCSWLPLPYAEQLATKQQRCAETLSAFTSLTWQPPFASEQEEFRNKAKMVVTGSVDAPALGILGDGAAGVDLRDCGIHEPAIRHALEVLAGFVTRAALTPYDIATRRGELKLVLVTAAPDGALMVRFVTRSTEPLARLRKHLPWLREQLPLLVVVTLNLQPEHKAVVEGPEDIVLTEEVALTMRVNEFELLLRPQSFFQTNTAVAAGLYREAARIAAGAGVGSVWDLYCGVGGFAIHLAGGDRVVVGVESSTEAVAGARESARRAGLQRTDFEAANATTWAIARTDVPDLVVVNPPRRGIGPDLAGWLERSGTRRVLYSSCNPESLARDLTAMPSLVPGPARLFDMFPHTDHAEVLVLLERAGR